MIHHKPCTCSCCPGTMYFSEVETFQAGSEYEWSYSYHWCCDTCGEFVGQWSDKFEYPEDY